MSWRQRRSVHSWRRQKDFAFATWRNIQTTVTHPRGVHKTDGQPREQTRRTSTQPLSAAFQMLWWVARSLDFPHHRIGVALRTDKFPHRSTSIVVDNTILQEMWTETSIPLETTIMLSHQQVWKRSATNLILLDQLWLIIHSSKVDHAFRPTGAFIFLMKMDQPKARSRICTQKI